MNVRELEEKEVKLIKHLVTLSGNDFSVESYQGISMEDGGQGSVLLIAKNVRKEEDREMGSHISEQEFKDSDGTPILVSLNIDKDGCLYELDIWRTDYNPVHKYPSVDDI